MNTPATDKNTRITAELEQSIKSIASAQTKVACGLARSEIEADLKDVIALVEEVLELLKQDIAPEDAATPTGPSIAVPETDRNEQDIHGDAPVAEPSVFATVVERFGQTFPDDAPDSEDMTAPAEGTPTGEDAEEEEINNDNADSEETDALAETEEDDPNGTEVFATDTEYMPIPMDLVDASKRIYLAAKFINRAIDNRWDIDPNSPEIADITYRLAAWLRAEEDAYNPHTTHSKAARHLRHIARFIAKSRRRHEFHYVRRVRKFRG